MRFSGLSKSCLAVVLSLFAVAGCDDGGSGGSGGSGASGGSGGSGASGGSGGSGGATTTDTDTGTAGSGGGTTDFTACEGKFEGQSADCQGCVQSSCADTLIACCETDGCAEIVSCAREAGCGGIECYTANGMPGPCAAVIDGAGGPVGAAAGAAQDFGGCAQMQCTEACTM